MAVRLTSAQLVLVAQQSDCSTARAFFLTKLEGMVARAKVPGLALPFTAIHVGLGQYESHHLWLGLVAILTAWVTRNPIDPAAAATTGVPWAPGAPARALGDPADLGVADCAADPVAAVLLLHHDPALRAVHGLALLQHHP